MSRLSVRRPKAYLDGLLARAIAGVFAGCAVNNVTLGNARGGPESTCAPGV